MTATEKLERHLIGRSVPFLLHHYPSAAFTAQELAELEGIPGRLVAKVVMAFADDRLVMFVLPAPSWLDLKKAAEELGCSAVRLAHEDEFVSRFPDCEPGSMPPFGNLYGIPVYIDRSVMRVRTVFFQAGTHRDGIQIESKDLVGAADSSVVDVALSDAA